MAAATSSPTHCYHCGDDCTELVRQCDDIRHDDRHFCCEGCKTVYSILNQHELCQYYAIGPRSVQPADERNKPGKTRPTRRTGDRPSVARPNRDDGPATRLDFLDHPDIVVQLLDFSSETAATVTFYIPTIHCSSCLWLLEHLYRIDSGIGQSRVDFLKKGFF